MCFNFSGYAHKYQIFIYVLTLFITLVSHFKRWIGDFFLCFPLNTTTNSGYIHNKQTKILRVREMIYWVKGLAIMLEILNSIPRSHMVQRENKSPLSPHVWRHTQNT